MRREYARLKQELQGKEYELLLQELKSEASFFHRFDTWGDVVDFMRDDTLNALLTDEVLRPIFKAHRKDNDPRWRTILLVIFWPGLESIHWRKRGWDNDLEERWQNIVWTFLQIVCRIDVSRRPDRLAQKTINDTVHRLHDEYSRIWKIKSREIMHENEEFEFLAGGREGINYTHIALRYAQRAEIRRLRKHLEEGRISEADYLMLVGTRVYGKSLLDYSLESGLDYEAVRKRRLRIEAAIREHEKNLQKMSHEVE